MKKDNLWFEDRDNRKHSWIWKAPEEIISVDWVVDEAGVFFLFTDHVHQAWDVGPNVSLNITQCPPWVYRILPWPHWILVSCRREPVNHQQNLTPPVEMCASEMTWERKDQEKGNLEKPFHVPHWCVDLLGSTFRIILFLEEFSNGIKAFSIRNHLDFYDCLLLLYINAKIAANERQE